MADATRSVRDGLDQTKLHFTDVGGVRTRYYENGAAEPLVLMSGGEFFGALYSLDAWSLNLPELARHFHVFAIDKLGQGYTDNPPSEAQYTFEPLLQHTYGLLRAVGLTSGVHLVGHSRGALLAAALTLAHPELVASTIIVDSSTLAPDDPRYPGMVFYTELETRMPRGRPREKRCESRPLRKPTGRIRSPTISWSECTRSPCCPSARNRSSAGTGSPRTSGCRVWTA